MKYLNKRKLIFPILLFITFCISVTLYLAKLESECEVYEYDVNGNFIYYYAGNKKGGTKQYFKYNENNQEIESKVIRNISPACLEVMTKTFAYDDNGLLQNYITTYTINDNVTRTSKHDYFYNENKQLVKQVSSSGDEWVYEYDDQGHKKSVISSNGDISKFEYNSIKNEDLKVEYSFDSTVVKWVYDDSGRVLKEYSDNNSHEWFYDKANPQKLSKEIIINEKDVKEITYNGNWIITKSYQNHHVEKFIQMVKYTYWPNKKIKKMKKYNVNVCIPG